MPLTPTVPPLSTTCRLAIVHNSPELIGYLLTLSLVLERKELPPPGDDADFAALCDDLFADIHHSPRVTADDVIPLVDRACLRYLQVRGYSLTLTHTE